MSDRLDAGLIVVFKVGKPEEFVFLQRPTQVETALAPGEEGVGILRFSFKSGVCGQIVVAEKEEAASVISLVPVRETTFTEPTPVNSSPGQN